MSEGFAKGVDRDGNEAFGFVPAVKGKDEFDGTYTPLASINGIDIIRKSDVNAGTAYEWGKRHEMQGATAKNWCKKHGKDAIVGQTVSARAKSGPEVEYSFDKLDKLYEIHNATTAGDIVESQDKMIEFLRSQGFEIVAPESEAETSDG